MGHLSQISGAQLGGGRGGLPSPILKIEKKVP